MRHHRLAVPEGYSSFRGGRQPDEGLCYGVSQFANGYTLGRLKDSAAQATVPSTLLPLQRALQPRAYDNPPANIVAHSHWSAGILAVPSDRKPPLPRSQEFLAPC